MIRAPCSFAATGPGPGSRSAPRTSSVSLPPSGESSRSPRAAPSSSCPGATAPWPAPSRPSSTTASRGGRATRASCRAALRRSYLPGPRRTRAARVPSSSPRASSSSGRTGRGPSSSATPSRSRRWPSRATGTTCGRSLGARRHAARPTPLKPPPTALVRRSDVRIPRGAASDRNGALGISASAPGVLTGPSAAFVRRQKPEEGPWPSSGTVTCGIHFARWRT